MDGESGDLTEWKEVVGAGTGKSDTRTGMRLTLQSSGLWLYLYRSRKVLFWNKWRKRNEREPANPCSRGKRPLKRKRWQKWHVLLFNRTNRSSTVPLTDLCCSWLRDHSLRCVTPAQCVLSDRRNFVTQLVACRRSGSHCNADKWNRHIHKWTDLMAITVQLLLQFACPRLTGNNP